MGNEQTNRLKNVKGYMCSLEEGASYLRCITIDPSGLGELKNHFSALIDLWAADFPG